MLFRSCCAGAGRGGCFLASGSSNDFIGDGAEVNYIQGEAMGRPSKIKSTLNIEGDRCGIKVGGNAVVLAEGDIHI